MRDSTSVATSCTVQRRNGHFCDAPAWPDAPFPICRRHAIKLFLHMDYLTRHQTNCEARRAFGEIEYRRQGDESAEKSQIIVYYVQVGQLVKIGMTTDLRQRLYHYPPDSKLLAYELGNSHLEVRRHDQFKHLLRYGNEWFTMGPDLDAHITKLRDTRRRTNATPVAS